jgi:hypothetical protein
MLNQAALRMWYLCVCYLFVFLRIIDSAYSKARYG